MSPELDKKLCDKYPVLYRERHLDMRQTAMCWGFPGDGWYLLLEVLSTVITARAKEEGLEVSATGVKEKFGTLVFSVAGGDSYISGAIRTASILSGKICMACGDPGQLHTDGWFRTLCVTHEEAYQRRGNLDGTAAVETVRSLSSPISNATLIDTLSKAIEFDVRYNDVEPPQIIASETDGSLKLETSSDNLRLAGMMGMLASWCRRQGQAEVSDRE